MTEVRIQDSLVDLATDLRSGTLAPSDYLTELEGCFTKIEGSIHAFMPEQGRSNRLANRVWTLENSVDPTDPPSLYGVPIGVKDIFHVDGLETLAGSRLPAEELAGGQSEAVTQLENAGAIVLGKTVTTEFAYFGPGPTRNPLDLERTPGGSSSGSAAAVAAGLCPLALGTQTIGSIGRPASYCGIVGFKPSYCRISTEGVIPLAPSLDHVGFFTRDVAGARLAAGVLCDHWRDVSATGRRPTLGVPEGPYLDNALPETLEGFRSTLDLLASAGYEIRSAEALQDCAAIDTRHRRLVAAEAARVHSDWYPRYSDLYQAKTRALIDQGQKVPDEELEGLRAGREALRADLEQLMDSDGIDLWLSPAAQGPAPRGLDSTGDPVMNLPWTHAGVPTLAVPAWKTGGLPMGLQIAARFDADEELLGWGIGLEEALGR